MDYRYKNCVNVITLPSGFEEEDRGLKGCCIPCLVLASTSESESWKNDVLGVHVKLSQISDSVTFIMEDCEGTILTNFGDIGVYPNDNLARGFIYDWKQVLQNYGAGKYKVRVEYNVSGITGGFIWGIYELKNYSIENAKGTVRIWSEFDSYLQTLNIDFTNSNHKDSIRFNGFFGNREPKTDIVNLITKGRKVEKATRENLNTYTLTSDPVSICVTRRVLDFHLLSEDKCLITDHNKYNHDYLIQDKSVVLEESPDVEYLTFDRKATLIVKFGDRVKNQKSFYNK